jgi:hypothetical protein
MPLEPQAFASAHAELAAAVVTTGIVPLAAIRCEPRNGTRFETTAVEHSPPDLTVLHSTLLFRPLPFTHIRANHHTGSRR